MNVKFALLADFASKTDTGKLNLLGLFDQLSPQALPYSHPQMFLVVQYAASRAEIGVNRRFQTRLLDDDGRELFAATQEMVVPTPNIATQRLEIAQIIGLNGVRFDRPGDYQFSILVDDDEKATVALTVIDPANSKLEVTP